MPEPHVPRLTRATLAEAARSLAQRDSDLARVLRLHGLPPLWGRPPGFRTLVQIILEQQVSLASGRAALARLQQRVGRVTPERICAAGSRQIRSVGVTRQKSRYIVELAHAVRDNTLQLSHLARLDDDDARSALTQVVGIGRWTADVYLLMALRRADVWPSGDLALAKAVQTLKRLPALPTPTELDALAKPWVPLRAVAARVLWHYYLSGGDAEKEANA